MTNNPITATALTNAADLIVRLRDHAIAAERDIRGDDPLHDYDDAINLVLDTDESLSPDTADAIRALIDTLDN